MKLLICVKHWKLKSDLSPCFLWDTKISFCTPPFKRIQTHTYWSLEEITSAIAAQMQGLFSRPPRAFKKCSYRDYFHLTNNKRVHGAPLHRDTQGGFFFFLLGKKKKIKLLKLMWLRLKARQEARCYQEYLTYHTHAHFQKFFDYRKK